jgi:predicted small integral membrane protein
MIKLWSQNTGLQVYIAMAAPVTSQRKLSFETESGDRSYGHVISEQFLCVDWRKLQPMMAWWGL